MKKKTRVVVAMSGGVDSSVAAALLKKQGYEVIGMTMCFNLKDAVTKRPACCGIQGIEDARRVCHKLGIRHYVLNMKKPLEELVIKDFCAEYLRGRTPNPCIRCNQYLKFDILLKKALSLDAKFLATGHYARIQKTHNARRTTHNYSLMKAKDRKKDQSYFLYRLNQGQLKHTLFPLGNYTKEQVRAKAREFGLAVAEKNGSQEICFIGGDDYRAFLKSYIKQEPIPGAVLDSAGNKLGEHQGIAFYTIGQRAGLGIARGYPLYITGMDHRENTITVGSKEDCLKREFLAEEAHFIRNAPKNKIVAKARIRYNHKECAAEIIPCRGMLKIKFKKPQFAITPGQSVVFYDQTIVLGGGVISKVLN